MNTKQQTLTLEDIRINDGKVRPDEKPLWVGLSNAAINGQRIRMSVTSDDGWFWLRFKTQTGMLAPEQHADMQARGWKFSKKKRLGYWHDAPDQTVVKFIRALGYTSAALTDAVATPKQEKLAGPLTNATTVSRPAPSNPLPVVDVPTSSGLRYNKAGRLIDANGKFVKASDVAAASEASALPFTDETPSPAGWAAVETSPEDVSDDNTEDYALGYEDGVADADDPDVPATYSRTDMAKREGMTVMHLTATLGNAYIQGYLEGFEAQRPKPQPVRGLAARILAMREGRG